MKRTSSWTVRSSPTSLAPRSRKKPTRRSTSSSGALAPEVMPTVSTPSSQASSTWVWLSIRCEAAPCSRATSTRRLEFEELVEPITRTRSDSARQLLHRDLAVGGRVTDVVGLAGDDRRELRAQRFDHLGGLVDRERRLGDEGDLVGIGDPQRRRLRRRFRSGRSTRAPRPSSLRPPRGRRGRSSRSCSPAAAKRRAETCTLVTSGQVASIVRRLREAAFSCTAGATPWAEKTTIASSGTSVSCSTKIAPRSASSSTTCLLWTISLRT